MLDPTNNALLPTPLTNLVTALCAITRPHEGVCEERISTPHGPRVVLRPSGTLSGQRWRYQLDARLVDALREMGPSAPHVVVLVLLAVFRLAHEDWSAGRTAFGELLTGWIHKDGVSVARVAHEAHLNPRRKSHLKRIKLAFMVLEDMRIETIRDGHTVRIDGLLLSERRITLYAPKPRYRHAEADPKARTAPAGHRGGEWHTHRIHPELAKMLNGRRARFVPVPLAALAAGGRAACLAALLYRARAMKATAQGQPEGAKLRASTLATQLGLAGLAGHRDPLELLAKELDRLEEARAIEKWEWGALKDGGRAVWVAFVNQGLSQECPDECAHLGIRRARVRTSRDPKDASAHISGSCAAYHEISCGDDSDRDPLVDLCRDSVGEERPPLPGGAPPD